MATETLRPNAVGDKTQLNQYPNSGNNWDKVDEVSPDENTTYVYVPASQSSPKTDLYNLPNPSLIGEGDTINSVKVRARARSQIGEGRCGIYIKTHGTEYTKTAHTTTTSYQTFGDTWNTNPNTGQPWTISELNNLQAGAELIRSIYGLFPPSFGYTRCTQVYVEVDYTPAPPPSESKQHSGTLMNPGVF